MAWFRRKKEEKKEEQAPKADVAPRVSKKETDVPAIKKAPKTQQVKRFDTTGLAHVLIAPRITEKATDNSMREVYVFDVAPRANKEQIIAAIRSVYKVEPLKVRVAPIPYKKVRNARTGAWGVKGGGRKAYVYLKEGDVINII